MNCVLLGYGTVGRQVEALCAPHSGLHLSHVYVRPQKAQEPYFTARGEEITADPDTALVFECMNGLEPANTLIRNALRNGKHVISSNKAVLSRYLPEYLELAKEHGGSLQIEASAGGGIPVLDAILKLSRAEPLHGFEGILNGTSNFILSEMEKNGTSFEEALQQAIDKGYAEKDPSSDLEGTDVWYKTLLICSLLTQSPVLRLAAPFGISSIQAKDIALAASKGRRIRHIAKIRNESGRHSALIAPVYVKEDDFFASVGSNYNAQLIYGDSFGSLGYYGQGAGGPATAQAMVANALDVCDHRIRTISLNRTSKEDPDLIVENWIVRTPQKISELPGLEDADPNFFEEEGYWYLPKKPQSAVRTVLERDPQAMIGVWKTE